MDFLYFLEGLRMPGLTEFMLLVTSLGEETAFLALALIVFWCVDKHKGYLLISVCFLGNLLNGTLKLIFRIPRPWVLDPDFTIVEQAREAATGYSFPSGHSQNAVGSFMSMALTAKNKIAIAIFTLCAVLVPLSRMYLGVHTPADVLVGSGCALALVLILRPIAKPSGERYMKPLLIVMLLAGILSLAFMYLYPFPADVDEANLASGMKNAYTMMGCIIGISISYLGEKKYVNFSTKAVWWVQLLKVVIGLVLVLLVKEGMRAPLELVFSAYVARAVRYCLIVIVAGFLWPMSFARLQRLGEKK